MAGRPAGRRGLPKEPLLRTYTHMRAHRVWGLGFRAEMGIAQFTKTRKRWNGRAVWHRDGGQDDSPPEGGPVADGGMNLICRRRLA